MERTEAAVAAVQEEMSGPRDGSACHVLAEAISGSQQIAWRTSKSSLQKPASLMKRGSEVGTARRNVGFKSICQWFVLQAPCGSEAFLDFGLLVGFVGPA